MRTKDGFLGDMGDGREGRTQKKVIYGGLCVHFIAPTPPHVEAKQTLSSKHFSFAQNKNKGFS